MPQTSVSSQDVYNHLQKFSDSWSQMDQALTQFVANRIVLEYQRKGDMVLVTVDGYTHPIRVPIRDAEQAPQDPAIAPEMASDALEESLASSQTPEKPKAKRGRPPKIKPLSAFKTTYDPIVLTIHGVKVDYRSHIRGLISKLVNRFDMATGESLADEFIREISEAS